MRVMAERKSLSGDVGLICKCKSTLSLTLDICNDKKYEKKTEESRSRIWGTNPLGMGKTEGEK